ncbi:hypothetical protein EE88_21700 [Salmonella enterica]|nr:hypothetical protein [Salmonella enterica]
MYTIKEAYPILYWITAICGGLGALVGVFAWIFKLFLFTRKPSILGFVALVLLAILFLINTGWWYAIAFGGAGDGWAGYDVYPARLPDPKSLYYYWAWGVVQTVIYYFWIALNWWYERNK